MYMLKDKDHWLFIDVYDNIWMIEPTHDPENPITITLLHKDDKDLVTRLITHEKNYPTVFNNMGPELKSTRES